MNLYDVLDRATDGIESSHSSRSAWTASRKRRARRRVVAGAAAAVVCVVGAVALVGTQGADGQPTPVTPVTPPTPSDPASSDPAPSESGGPTPDSPTVALDEVTQPLWDPFTVVDEPLHPTSLPERLEPPATAPSVASEPMERGLIAWPERGQDLRILGVDGGWRSVPDTATAVHGTLADVVDPALSSDGTRVAMSANDGIWVIDLTTGDRRVIPWPGALAEPTDTAPDLRWMPDDEGWAVLHARGTWIVDLDGEGRKAPYGGPYGGFAIDPDGSIVDPFQVPASRGRESELRVWRGDELVSRAQFPYWGTRFAAGHGRVAFTGSPGHGSTAGPMVVDPATGDPVAYAPIRDRNSVYSDGPYLTSLGFLDEDTVLLLVGPIDLRTMELGEEQRHLVAWSTDTSEFELLTSGDTRMAQIDVAVGVLAADWES